MTLFEVNNTTTQKAFLDLPRVIYRNDPNWIPHLKQDIEKVFDIKVNRSFRDGEAIRWVLLDGEQCLGRVAAFISPKYSKGMEQPTGGMGFFECINNQKAANILFDACKNWLTGKGVVAMDGPINFGEKDRFWGLLVENFTDLSSYALNYNPEYYIQLFENYGFKRYYNQFIYWRDLHLPAQEVFVRKYNHLMKDSSFRISNVRNHTWDQMAEDFRTVYNNAWGGHHGFKAMPEAQSKRIIKSLKPIIDRDIIVFVYHNNKPVAFYVNIPELNEIFKFVGGDLNLLGKMKFLWHKWRKTSKIMVGIVFGVDRAYHGQGLEGAMIKWTEDNIVSLNRYHTTTLTWIGDFNPKMIHVAENLGAIKYRTLATYRCLFDPNQEFSRSPIVE